jgi:hypothetical protein
VLLEKGDSWVVPTARLQGYRNLSPAPACRDQRLSGPVDAVFFRRYFARAASLQVPSSLELLFLTTSLQVLDR